ncbi:UNVERIFIED_CONTAM: hypothetical protein K2H54_066406, partial [Gekko kuhli]
MKVVMRGSIISAMAHLKRETEKLCMDTLNKITALEQEHKTSHKKSTYLQLQVEKKVLEAIELKKIPKNLLILKQKFWQKSKKKATVTALKASDALKRLSVDQTVSLDVLISHQELIEVIKANHLKKVVPDLINTDQTGLFQTDKSPTTYSVLSMSLHL